MRQSIPRVGLRRKKLLGGLCWNLISCPFSNRSDRPISNPVNNLSFQVSLLSGVPFENHCDLSRVPNDGGVGIWNDNMRWQNLLLICLLPVESPRSHQTNFAFDCLVVCNVERKQDTSCESAEDSNKDGRNFTEAGIEAHHGVHQHKRSNEEVGDAVTLKHNHTFRVPVKQLILLFTVDATVDRVACAKNKAAVTNLAVVLNGFKLSQNLN